MDQPIGHQRSPLVRVHFGAFHLNVLGHDVPVVGVNDDPTFFPGP